jgi:hypothetical protein
MPPRSTPPQAAAAIAAAATAAGAMPPPSAWPLAVKRLAIGGMTPAEWRAFAALHKSADAPSDEQAAAAAAVAMLTARFRGYLHRIGGQLVRVHPDARPADVWPLAVAVAEGRGTLSRRDEDLALRREAARAGYATVGRPAPRLPLEHFLTPAGVAAYRAALAGQTPPRAATAARPTPVPTDAAPPTARRRAARRR